MDSELFLLNSREEKVINLISSLDGTIEDREMELIKLKIPEEYNIIHSEYTKMNENTEALKRALFLQWYSVSEPFSYSGLLNLDTSAQEFNIAKLNELVSKSVLDSELNTMIIYYYTITDWYFEKYKGFSELINYLRRNNSNFLDLSTIKPLVGRGQMGIYWNSIQPV